MVTLDGYVGGFEYNCLRGGAEGVSEDANLNNMDRCGEES